MKIDTGEPPEYMEDITQLCNMVHYTGIYRIKLFFYYLFEKFYILGLCLYSFLCIPASLASCHVAVYNMLPTLWS